MRYRNNLQMPNLSFWKMSNNCRPAYTSVEVKLNTVHSRLNVRDHRRATDTCLHRFPPIRSSLQCTTSRSQPANAKTPRPMFPVKQDSKRAGISKQETLLDAININILICAGDSMLAALIVSVPTPASTCHSEISLSRTVNLIPQTIHNAPGITFLSHRTVARLLFLLCCSCCNTLGICRKSVALSKRIAYVISPIKHDMR